MVRVLLFFVILFLLALGFVWLADNPGEVTLRFADYVIETTVMAMAVALVLGLVLVWLIFAVIRGMLRYPRIARRKAAARRRERGQLAQQRSLVALGAGDASLASYYAAESRMYLRDDPLTLLAAAQAAQLAGDTMGARSAFEMMLTNEETRMLGLRGLFVEAQRRNDPHAARSFAEAAMREKASLGWAGEAMLQYQASDGDWVEALKTLARLSQASGINSARAARLRAVILTARAWDLEEHGEPENARDLAFEAHKLAPDLVPAAVTAARLATRLGDPKRAAKAIETTWKIEPHPELATAYMDVRPGEPGRDRLKRMRGLVKIRANHLEGQLALARAAIDTQDWATARDELKGVVATTPTVRAYLLMAEVEEGEHNDIGRARDWLSRALRAPRDPAWMADGFAFDAWQPVSPVSGKLDAFEWKVPAERPPVAGELTSPEPVTGPVAEASRALAVIAASETPPIAPATPVAEPVALAEVVTAEPVAADAGGDDGPPRQPDDPGPDPDRPPAPADPAKPRRFRLF